MIPALWIALLIGAGMCIVLPSRAGSHHFRYAWANVVMGLLVVFVVCDVAYLVLSHQL